jgi:ADP-ribose pyrophosphatase
MFLATDLMPGEMALEPGEEIEPFLCPWRDALKLAETGKIRDAKSLVGLLYYEQFQKK